MLNKGPERGRKSMLVDLANAGIVVLWLGTCGGAGYNGVQACCNGSSTMPRMHEAMCTMWHSIRTRLRRRSCIRRWVMLAASENDLSRRSWRSISQQWPRGRLQYKV